MGFRFLLNLFICAALTTLVFSAAEDFPKDDILHAYCELDATYLGVYCSDLFDKMNA
eukprot:CAMPEP_0170556496 /NCGR_PEP_ID=MMETSP0211-20121228/17103_1 /TAXON_ID=311385 /ORGANISM="Pseudokeronopsis sp., Strain OXSARD2" /LENGTH=56 /DNA_ID=CAMNT_0010866861 /DNA_START=1 /DNA_END=167 /DNA_ORIENTATION=+